MASSSGTAASIRSRNSLELARPMPAAEGADHRAADQVERGEQAGGAVADVVVTAPRGGAQEHRQDRCEAVEGLDLALLVDTTHHVRSVDARPRGVCEGSIGG